MKAEQGRIMEAEQRKAYFARLEALYETLDNLLHPTPRKPLRKDITDRFIVMPDFAPEVHNLDIECEGNNYALANTGYVYFEKLDAAQQKKVKALLRKYISEGHNILVLPPRRCSGAGCAGHYNLDDLALNQLPGKLEHSFIYFIA